jgi:hypothetical protein
MSDWAPPGGSDPAGERTPAPAPGWQPSPAAPEQPPQSWSAPSWSTPPPWTSAPGGWQPYAPPPAPKPGVIPLRPLGVGELLDGAFTVIRRYPAATLGFAAIVMLVVEVVQVVSNYFLLNNAPSTSSTNDLTTSQAADLAARLGATGIVTLLITGLAVLILTGVVTTVVGEGVLGRSITAAQAWARLRTVFARLIGVSLMTFLIVAAVIVVGAVPGIVVLAAGSGPGGAVLLVLGLIAATVFAVYFWTALSLAPAAVVLERQPVMAALRRSRALVRGSWWRVFGILLLAAIISSIVSGIITVPFGIAGGGFTLLRGNEDNHLSFVNLLLNGIGGLLAGTIVRPFTAGVTALLYIDRRMRAEALDMTLQSAAASR